MSFVSWPFIALCAALIVVYYALSRLAPGVQWLALLAASYVFYLYSSPKLAVFLAFSTVTTWLFPLLTDRENRRLAEKLALPENAELSGEEKKKIKAVSAAKNRMLLSVCVAVNLLILGLLKYAGFFLKLFGSERTVALALPLGISFYTFQGIGYCADVFRGVVPAEKNLFRHALYVSYFPQISQGPIGRYSELAPQLFSAHRFELNRLKTGAERMLLGFFKKIIVANNLGSFVNSIYAEPGQYSGVILAFATFLYAFELYADFSGYMDIVCGISECMGIRLAENFETPYFSRSITEFWRRWHISLGAWFKDYLYYPLLRTKAFSALAKKLRKSGHKKAAQNLTVSLGLLITWFVIGFWHGAGFNYIAYGLFHGTFVILNGLLAGVYESSKKRLHINGESVWWKGFQIIRTFAIVCFGYVLFISGDLTQALTVYGRIFTRNFYFGWSHGLLNPVFDRFFWICMAAALMFCLFIELIEVKERFIHWLNRQKLPLRWAVLYVMMLSVACALLFSDAQEAASGNFLYFNF